MPFQFGGGTNWTHPLLQQINRQGDIIQYADQAQRANDELAMKKKLFEQKIAEEARTKMLNEALRNAMTEATAAGGKLDLNAIAGKIAPYDPKTAVELAAKAAEIEAKKREVQYDIKENEQGEYVRIPRLPGFDVNPTGVKAAPQKWEVHPPAPKEDKENKPPPGYMWNKDGTLAFIPGGPADPATRQNQREQGLKPPMGFEWADEEKTTLRPVKGGPHDPLARPAKPMPASMVEDINGIDQVMKALDEATEMYYGTTGNKPGAKWVGMFDSALGSVGGKVNAVANPKEQRFRSLIQQQFNIQGKLRAGAAWTQPEINRLMAELPSTGDSETAFEQKLDLSRQMLLAKKKALIENARSSGYRTPDQAGDIKSSEEYEIKSVNDLLKKHGK